MGYFVRAFRFLEDRMSMRRLINRLEEAKKPRAGMDADTHETVYGLGAKAGRESRDGDVSQSFVDAIEKYGTRVFPAKVGRFTETHPMWDEFLSVFKEGFDSAYRD